MRTDHTQSVHDARLWRRIVLVGLIGAVPLFVVSLILINVAYSAAIDFGQQEQRGNAFQRPLERLLELLPHYQAVLNRPSPTGTTNPPERAKLEQQIDEAPRVRRPHCNHPPRLASSRAATASAFCL